MRKSEVVAAESVACLNKALSHLKDIWEEIGIPEEQRLQRTVVVKNHVRNLLDMMIAEEEELKKRLVTSIEMCHKDLEVLCRELRLPPFEEEHGLTVLQQEKNVRTQLEVLLKQKNHRLEEVRTLKLQEQDLCHVLCTDTFRIDHATVPSLEQLESYRQHLASLTAEKERRHAEFVRVKKQILLLMEDLDKLPDTSFEKEVMFQDEETFCLSEENLASLRRLFAQLKDQKAENEVLCNVYRMRIQEMWNQLQISQEDRDAFSHHMVMSRKKNMDALQAETKRLEELNLQNIRDVIESRRAELALYWEKCFLSEAQRRAFQPYYNENFTEELLQLHDAEVQCLRDHYEKHKELYEGVQRWEESWKLFLELERRANDPSRFTNRGGNLLKEEKQRGDLHKSLPKLERMLKVRVEAWEQEQMRPFLVSGQEFLQHVREQWELHQCEKEQEKQERQLKKNRQREEEMLYGSAARTPCGHRPPGAGTPGRTCKQCVRTPGQGKVPEHNKENVLHLNKAALPTAWRPHTKPQSQLSTISAVSNYSQFTRELSKASSIPTCGTTALNSTATDA